MAFSNNDNILFMSVDSIDNTGKIKIQPYYFTKNEPEKWSLLKFLKRKKHEEKVNFGILWNKEYQTYEENINRLTNQELKKTILD